MKRLSGILVLFITVGVAAQQPLSETITVEKTQRHLEWLASDSLKGRGNGSKELYIAAKYIAQQYETWGLKPLPGQHSYFIPFPFDAGDKIRYPAYIFANDKTLHADRFRWIGWEPFLENTLFLHDFTVIHFEGEFTEDILQRKWPGEGNLLLWTTSKDANGKPSFPKNILPRDGGMKRNVLLVSMDEPLKSIQMIPDDQYLRRVGHNMAAYLPGNKFPNEQVIVSSHYDHLLPRSGSKEIWNGANDNASGTTALLLLAEHYSKQPAPARDLLFISFSGEELGLVGSEFLASKMENKHIAAMINLEMLAIPQFGRKTVFITGSTESELPKVLKTALTENGIKVRKEPKGQFLFYRSDNLHFAVNGIPAHTIMASDGNDKCYHKACDDPGRVDYDNLAILTRAIARAVDSVLNAATKPKRISRVIEPDEWMKM